LGFSIPINNAKKVISDFIEYGAVQYGWLGVSIAELLPDAAKAMKVEDMGGAFIYHIFQDSPADQAGILPGDFIIKMGEHILEGSNQLVLLIGDIGPGKEIDFTLIRNGEQKSITVRIGLRGDTEAISNNSRNLWPGIGVIPLTENLRSELAVPEDLSGVVVSEVEPKTIFQELGVRFGDILTEINGKKTGNMLEFYNIVNSLEEHPREVAIVRNGQTISLNEKHENSE
jgi:S1-C subfamily serine protease